MVNVPHPTTLRLIMFLGGDLLADIFHGKLCCSMVGLKVGSMAIVPEFQ